jgi:hypothetical protein
MGHRHSGISLAWACTDHEVRGMDNVYYPSRHSGRNIVAVLVPARPSPRISGEQSKDEAFYADNA